MPELLHLHEVSRVAGEIDNVFIFILLLGLFFFIVTQGCLIYFAFKYRGKRTDVSRETPYITGSHLLEAVWIVIPSICLLAIFLYGFAVFRNIRTPPADSMEINVTAEQWLYKFKYPDGRTEVNEVRVPVGKPVKFIMTSADVIHGFYLPAFRVKQDILPGSYTYLWVQPQKVGEYEIFCTQYCGTGHSTMRAELVVMNGKDYQKWFAGVKTGKAEPLWKRGEEVVEHSGCLSCHTIDGTVKVGPTFKGLYGHQVVLSDGTTANVDDNYIRESILDPNAKIVKGFPPVMPTFKETLKDEDIAAVIAYIKTLK
jgi:cytochrome c oxidase subunit 2